MPSTGARTIFPRPPLAPAAAKPALPPAKPPIENHATPVSPISPRKETARIVPAPEAPMKATVKLSSAPPSSEPPISVVRTIPPGLLKPPGETVSETIPAQYCWALLGISVLALLIQLWIYFS